MIQTSPLRCRQPEGSGGNDNITQAEGYLIWETFWWQEPVGKPGKPDVGSLQQNVFAMPKPAAKGSCLEDFLRNQSAGGLQADRHESTVRCDDQEVQGQAKREQPRAGHMPVHPAKNQQEDL